MDEATDAMADSATPPAEVAPTSSNFGRAVVHFIFTLPQNILILLLKVYRKLISPTYGSVCRFFPTCSAYALEAVTVHGALKGSALAARRIVKCHPWNSGGIDHVPAGHQHYGEQSQTPYIIQLNHPERYLPSDVAAEGREAA
ncbi:MAG: membrane protein insertion efficiency factor YidD [Acidobacteria bacterium]|nr:membrane protein insertion efficiency factor YidD [Acidobacteriota bacterium]